MYLTFLMHALNYVTFVQKLTRLAHYNDIAIAALRNNAHVKPTYASLAVTACGHAQHSNSDPIYPGLGVDCVGYPSVTERSRVHYTST